jgi:hypothetical protein
VDNKLARHKWTILLPSSDHTMKMRVHRLRGKENESPYEKIKRFLCMIVVVESISFMKILWTTSLF